MVKFGHRTIERNSILMLVLTLIVVSIGGLVEIVPLYYLDSTVEKVRGMRPYSPLELIGRNVYIREGCYNCHSQMVRSLRDEVDRYGALQPGRGEHVRPSVPVGVEADRPGPCPRGRPLFRRMAPRAPDPPEERGARIDHAGLPVPDGATRPGSTRVEADLRTNAALGVPYTEDMLSNARADAAAQADPDSDGADAVRERYPKAQVRDFDGNPDLVSEMDAMIAYLQMLGTLVDFDAYRAEGEALR